MLARHLHEAAHVRPRLPGEQGLASGRRAVIHEVLERGVVGQERHRFMDEVQHGNTDRLSHDAAYSPPPWAPALPARYAPISSTGMRPSARLMSALLYREPAREGDG